MKVHEYQAKEVVARYGVPTPKGRVAETADEAKAIAMEIAAPVAVKAQIHAGGRGKGGGIKLAGTPEEAREAADKIIGMQLVTHQTGPEGKLVKRVLVEEQLQVERELYLSVVIDNSIGLPIVMASAEGGVEIEEVAPRNPGAIHRTPVDPTVGFQPFQGRQLAMDIGLTGDLMRPAAALIGSLYRAFDECDCSLAEINPLVVTKDGRILAADAKLNFDDNALYRHKDLAEMRDLDEEDPLEVEAQESGVGNYVKLTGDIGCVVNGAGLAMATMDAIKLAGGDPANFLDIGTVNDVGRVVASLRIITEDPSVRAILVNIFGGMARVDIIAQGIIQAHQELDIHIPVVARLIGTNVEEGERLLAESGISLIRATDLGEAAAKAVEAATAALFWHSATPAQACSCAGPSSTDDMVADAGAIVMGRVADYRPAGEGEFPGLTGSFPRVQITISVDRYLKGSGSGSVAVYQPTSRDGSMSSCSLFHEQSVGREYLLFLDGDSSPYTVGGVCSGSSLIYDIGDVYFEDMPESVGATSLLEQEQWLGQIRAVTGPGVAPETTADVPSLPFAIAAIALPLAYMLAASFVFPAKGSRP